MLRPPLGSPLLPSTTLFRSVLIDVDNGIGAGRIDASGGSGIGVTAGGGGGRVAVYTKGAPVGFQVDVAGGSSSTGDRKSTRLNSSHMSISYAVFFLKKKKQT